MRVLACGEALWDLIAEEGAEGLVFRAVPGGSPFNVAVGLARLGVPAGLVAGVSTDALGQRLAARLAAEGVATAHLARTPRPSGVSLIATGPGGEPAYSIHGEGAADRAVTAADLPALEGIGWLHFASYALVVAPCGAAFAALAERAGERILSFDPNVRLMVEPDAALWRASVAAWAARADIVKASAEDIGLLWPGADPASVAAGWLGGHTRLVVLTRGAAGASAFTAEGRLDVPAHAVTVVDTVGAGDSFMAALIAALADAGLDHSSLSHARLRPALAFAARAAALTCARRGADPPTRAALGEWTGGD